MTDATQPAVQRYRVEIVDEAELAVDHIEASSGLDAVDAAQAAYPSALGFTVSAVVDRT